jgi:GTPase involved in cell partitioning and DNA repair
VLLGELRQYHKALAEKPMVVVMSRADLAPEITGSDAPFPLEAARWGGRVSGVTGEGTKDLLELIWTMLVEAGGAGPEAGPWDGDRVADVKE